MTCARPSVTGTFPEQFAFHEHPSRSARNGAQRRRRHHRSPQVRRGRSTSSSRSSIKVARGCCSTPPRSALVQAANSRQLAVTARTSTTGPARKRDRQALGLVGGAGVTASRSSNRAWQERCDFVAPRAHRPVQGRLRGSQIMPFPLHGVREEIAVETWSLLRAGDQSASTVVGGDQLVEPDLSRGESATSPGRGKGTSRALGTACRRATTLEDHPRASSPARALPDAAHARTGYREDHAGGVRAWRRGSSCW